MDQSSDSTFIEENRNQNRSFYFLSSNLPKLAINKNLATATTLDRIGITIKYLIKSLLFSCKKQNATQLKQTATLTSV